MNIKILLLLIIILFIIIFYFNTKELFVNKCISNNDFKIIDNIKCNISSDQMNRINKGGITQQCSNKYPNKIGNYKLSIKCDSPPKCACGDNLKCIYVNENGKTILKRICKIPESLENKILNNSNILNNNIIKVIPSLCSNPNFQRGLYYNTDKNSVELVKNIYINMLGETNKCSNNILVNKCKYQVPQAEVYKPLPPEVSIPQEIIQPEMVQPKMAPTSVVQPEMVPTSVVQPEIVPTSVVQPEMVQPEMVQPEMVQPEMVQPEMVATSVVQPEVVQPKVVQPKVVQPKVVQKPTVKIKNLLYMGESLKAGEYIQSTNKIFKLVFQPDGNICVNKNGKNVWCFGSIYPKLKKLISDKTVANSKLNFQLDTNICIFSSKLNRNAWCLGNQYWQSTMNSVIKKYGWYTKSSMPNDIKKKSYIYMQDDGNVTIYHNGVLLWAIFGCLANKIHNIMTENPEWAIVKKKKNLLYIGECLKAGEYIQSTNKIFKLVFQPDGNICVNKNGKNVWCFGFMYPKLISNKTVANSKLNFQLDSNLCIFSSKLNKNAWCLGNKYWQSTMNSIYKKYGWYTKSSLPNDIKKKSYIYMQDDGNVTIYYNGILLWAIFGGRWNKIHNMSENPEWAIINNRIIKTPQCNIKINGNCKTYPNMSYRGYFEDQIYGGPVPSDLNSCKNRRNSWIGSCNNKDILMKYISKSNEVTYSPQCNIKINGNCKNYPNMSNKGYFPDQKYGGPVPTNINSCKNRRNSWIGSCDNKNISMKYISSSDKETNLF